MADGSRGDEAMARRYHARLMRHSTELMDESRRLREQAREARQIAMERGADAHAARRRGHPDRARQLEEESAEHWRTHGRLQETARAIEREATEANTTLMGIWRQDNLYPGWRAPAEAQRRHFAALMRALGEEEEDSEAPTAPELEQHAQTSSASASNEIQPTPKSQPGRGCRHMMQGPGRAPVYMTMDGHCGLAPSGTPYVRSFFATDACFPTRRVWPHHQQRQQQQQQQQIEPESQEAFTARVLPAFQARQTTLLVNILEDLGRAFDAGNAGGVQRALHELDAWQLLAVDTERAHGALMVGFAMRWLETFLQQPNAPQAVPDLIGDLADLSEETQQAARRLAPVLDSHAEMMAIMLRTCEDAYPPELVEAARRLSMAPSFNTIGRSPSGFPRYEHEQVLQPTEVEPVFFSTMRLPSPQLHWEEARNVDRGDTLAAAVGSAMLDVFSHVEPNVPPRPPW